MAFAISKGSKALWLILAASLMAWLALPGTPSASERQPEISGPPNIVVIVTDDQRLGMSYLPTVQNRIVRLGTEYPLAVVPTSTCCPSRASILTGLYSHGTGVWSNARSPGLGPTGGWKVFHELGMDERTVATWLDPTHRTILVGKYLNNYGGTSVVTTPPGWNAWHAFTGINGGYYDYRLVHTHGRVTEYGSTARDYSTDVLGDLAVREIEATPATEPLFLYLALFAPHGPPIPAPRDRGLGLPLPAYEAPSLNERDVHDKPPWIRSLPMVDLSDVEQRRSLEWRTLVSVNDAVGAVLDALHESGRIHDTLLVFMSDNGVSWGDHRVAIGDKFLPYDAVSRVPLAVRWDGHVVAGARDRRLVLNLDVPATIADAAGVVPPAIDGRSLLGGDRRPGTILEAPPNAPGGGNGLTLDRPAYCGYRTRRYLYVHYASGEEELYDYRTDPYELQNRVGDPLYADVEHRLEAQATEGCVPLPPAFGW